MSAIVNNVGVISEMYKQSGQVGLPDIIKNYIATNLNYWGCNQYITQRALGASLPTARGGLLFAAFLKLLMPLIVVLPGIAAFVLYKQGMFQTEMLNSTGVVDVNKAYPTLLNLLPIGLKGLAFAALTAAIVASLAGKANSIATIYTLDIYKKSVNKNADERKLVNVGKQTIIIALLLAVFMSLLLGEKLMGEGKQGFQYIQEYSGFVSPGIFAMFILGFFWKKTTSTAALFATIGGFIFSFILKIAPSFINLSFLSSIGFAVPNANGVYEIPFIDRMSIVFILCIIGMYFISIIQNNKGIKPNALEIDTSLFKVSGKFAIGVLLVCTILILLYTYFY